MDQNLKQRLVGAVVITSLAAIFVPMLFDDPIDETGKMINELSIPDVPIKSFDTNSKPLAKNINDVMALPQPMLLQAESDKQKRTTVMVRWFLQVGLYSQKSNAILQQKKLRQQGFPVILSTESGKKGLLYRVRVGPELDKKRAEKMKVKIDRLNNIKSILTSVDK